MAAPILIVEDGSGVAGANSYASLATIQAFAKNRNIDISKFQSPQLIGFAFLAMDYIESFRARFKGSKTTATQALQWPRTINWTQTDIWTSWNIDVPTNVQIDGVNFPNNAIPPDLINAQCQLVMDQVAGVVITPTMTAQQQQVKAKRIGPLSTEYFQPVDAPYFPAFQNFMSQLLTESGGAFLSTVRV